ncbi:MAG: hypothetical protein IOC54_07405 [Methylobacterium sp.]|jgi:hypothetical protein|nr:hypothetical protein [Methylobacterium sp.]MCA3651650.1 hypothetical protein [Methylobacterium sp.]MCA4921653.1 hypothetical protein [Methylobacterium sp.]
MPNVPAKKAFKAVNTDHSVLLSEGTLFCRASTPCGGRIDGKPKLRITGKALRKVLAGIPPESEIRLMAHGHRAKGNCSDLDSVAPPGKAKAGRWHPISWVLTLGRGPIPA